MLNVRTINGTTVRSTLVLTAEEKAEGITPEQAFDSSLIEAFSYMLARLVDSAVLIDAHAFDAFQDELAGVFARMRHKNTLGSKRYDALVHEVNQVQIGKGLFGKGRSFLPSRIKVQAKYRLTVGVMKVLPTFGPNGRLTGVRVPLLGPNGVIWAIWHMPAYRKQFITENPRVTDTNDGKVVVMRGAVDIDDLNIPTSRINPAASRVLNRFGPKLPLIASNGGDLGLNNTPQSIQSFCTLVQYDTKAAATAAMKRVNGDADCPLTAGRLRSVTISPSGDAGAAVAQNGLITADGLRVDSPLSNSVSAFLLYCIFMGIDNAENTFSNERDCLQGMRVVERAIIVDSGHDLTSLVDCGLWTQAELDAVTTTEETLQTFFKSHGRAQAMVHGSGI